MYAMLASHYKGQLPDHYFIEPKIDGVRVHIFANAKKGEVEFLSRNMNEFKSLNYLKPAVLSLIANTIGDIILDGEVVAGTVQQTIASVFSENRGLVAKIYLFDVIKPDITLLERRMWMQNHLLFNNDIQLIPVFNKNGNVDETYKEARSLGYEGIVIKDTLSEYECGERSDAWQKLKPSKDVDLMVVGWKEGKVAETIGALQVVFNGKRCWVGSGFTEPQRRSLWEIRDELIGWIVEVQYQEITKAGAMRHPTFVRIRLD